MFVPGWKKERSSSVCAESKGRSRPLKKWWRPTPIVRMSLMQVVSARRALKSFSEEMIQSHLHECIEGAASQSEGRRELRSLLTVLKRYAV